jgi:hypothetical protein
VAREKRDKSVPKGKIARDLAQEQAGEDLEHNLRERLRTAQSLPLVTDNKTKDSPEQSRSPKDSLRMKTVDMNSISERETHYESSNDRFRSQRRPTG